MNSLKRKKSSNKNKISFDEKIHSLNIDVTKRRLIWVLIPVAIILIGVILISTLGFNLGIDFTGGTVISVVPNDINIEDESKYNEVKADIESVLAEYDLKATQFQKVENDEGLAINVRFQDKAGATEEDMNKLINNDLIPSLYEKFGMDQNNSKFDNFIQASDRIGATASGELLLKALIAIMVAVVLILIYIAIRFEVASGLAAIVALFSDMLITCSLVLMFRIQVNSTFIAALITIIGYSINNTIIVFDRIREIRKQDENKTMTNEQIANKAVSQSFVKTMNSTITTLIAVALLAVIGVGSVREFIIPIILGICSGIYSSLFVSPNLWVWMYRERKNKKKGDKKQNKLPSKVVVSDEVEDAQNTTEATANE